MHYDFELGMNGLFTIDFIGGVNHLVCQNGTAAACH